MEALGSIDDLIIRTKPDEKETIYRKLKEEQADLPLKSPELKRQNAEVVEQDIIKFDEKDFLDPSDDDDVKDTSNICFISDQPKPDDLKIDTFIHCIEFSKNLFQNRSIKDIFQQTKHIWINIKNSDARVWLSRNLKNCPFNISIIYSSKNQPWISQIEKVCKKSVKISYNKLKKIDSLNEEQFIQEVLSRVISLSKPTLKLGAFIKNCLGCSKNV